MELVQVFHDGILGLTISRKSTRMIVLMYIPADEAVSITLKEYLEYCFRGRGDDVAYVIPTTDAKSAIETLKRNRSVGLVITDGTSPDNKSLDILRVKQEIGHPAKAWFMFGNTSWTIVKQAKDMGADTFIKTEIYDKLKAFGLSLEQSV